MVGLSTLAAFGFASPFALVVPIELHAWAARHAVSPLALSELSVLLGTQLAAVTARETRSQSEGGSETRVQSQVRLAAPHRGFKLFRNNVGVLRDKRDIPVRYGLANDSKALNDRFKSSDLIGWRSVVITQQMVGQSIAQFVALEVKHAGWTYAGDAHEEAQLRFINLAAADGALAKFITGADQL